MAGFPPPILPNDRMSFASASGDIPWDTWQFAIVTLWGGRASGERTLDWLATAELPPKSVLYWVDNSAGSVGVKLREEWERRLRRRFLRLVWIRSGKPYLAKPGASVLDPGRHVHIARLYNLAFQRIREEVAITLEDDIVPPLDGVRSLLHVLEADSRVGLVAGVYRDRVHPENICVARDKQRWLDSPVYDALPAEPFEMGMTGCGFTMTLNRALQQALPVRCKRFSEGYALGWDGNLCRDLSALGYQLLAHPQVRCAHLCEEVAAYEAATGAGCNVIRT